MADEQGSAPTLGIDIGGTKVAVALVDADGRELAATRLATEPERGAAAVLGEALAEARAAFGATLGGADAVGVCVAGQVGPGGVLLGAPNLGWDGAPLGEITTRLFARRAVIMNDVHAAAWAEWRGGAGRGAEDVVVLFLGTGVGGAVIVDGRFLRGCTGTLGELGHVTLVAGGRQCHCRNAGCIVAYVSGWAIEARAHEAIAADPAAGAGIVAAAGEEITAEAVAAARDAGDPLALRLCEETGMYLGAAAVGLVNGWNPCRLILGGGVINGFPELLDATTRAIEAHALPAAARVVTVSRAALGNHAPSIGAALMARYGTA
jgi:glucokinase